MPTAVTFGFESVYNFTVHSNKTNDLATVEVFKKHKPYECLIAQNAEPKTMQITTVDG